MVKDIIRDTMLLKKKSEPATKDDLQVVTDLMDTLKFNKDRCVGMAANMIGVHKRIIAVLGDKDYIAMINPVIVKHSDKQYETDEGCLSLNGTRKTTRYHSIQVEYYDTKFRKKTQSFKGYTAQIIQHEIDHFDGILI